MKRMLQVGIVFMAMSLLGGGKANLAHMEKKHMDGWFDNWVDLSGDKSKDVVISAGSTLPDGYEGHPTTVRIPGTETIWCTWCKPHGGHGGQLARSLDGGRTWTREDHRLPEEAKIHWNCPSIYRIVGPDGKARMFIYSAWYGNNIRQSDKAMPSLVSEDDGLTWRALPPLGPTFRCVMTFTSIIPLKDGRVMGIYHRGPVGEDRVPLEQLVTISADGGFTWSEPKVICQVPNRSPCEGMALRSDDGNEIRVIMRENTRSGCGYMVYSRDEGETWSEPEFLSPSLTGDRHAGGKLPDGRWVITFRDMAPGSPTKGHFVAWCGTYDDIVQRRPGKRYKLLHSYAGWDCGYPGVTVFEDGTVLAVTYVKYWDDARKQSVVGCRFKP